jgi:kynurenine formamidase
MDVASAAKPGAGSGGPMRRIVRDRAMLIDVSQKIERGAVYRLGTPPVDIATQEFYHEAEGRYETTMLSLPAHTATHIDLVDREKRMSPERLIGRGKLVDVTHISKRQVRTADVERQVRIESGDFVFFRTGWSRFVGTDKYYAHPEISMDVLHWLVTKRINMVGIDALGLAQGGKHGEYDRFLVEHDIFVIENLANLSAIPTRKFRVYCFPLRIEGIDAIPARVVVDAECDV